MMKYILGWVACLLIVAVPLGTIFGSMGWDENLLVILGVLLSSGLFALILYISRRNKEQNHKMTCENMTYYSPNETLVLLKRSSVNKKVVKAKPFVIPKLNYHEAQYVFTSATVGGITTGGVHKTGDYHTLDATHTGKYEINYFSFCSNDYKRVKKIKLSPELTELAKQDSFIRMFLKEENTLVLQNPAKRNVSHETSLLMKSGKTDMAINNLLQNNSDTQLTKNECDRIISWISCDD